MHRRSLVSPRSNSARSLVQRECCMDCVQHDRHTYDYESQCSTQHLRPVLRMRLTAIAPHRGRWHAAPHPLHRQSKGGIHTRSQPTPSPPHVWLIPAHWRPILRTCADPMACPQHSALHYNMLSCEAWHSPAGYGAHPHRQLHGCRSCRACRCPPQLLVFPGVMVCVHVVAGLVARVIPAEELVDEAVKTAETIASYSQPIGAWVCMQWGLCCTDLHQSCGSA